MALLLYGVDNHMMESQDAISGFRSFLEAKLASLSDLWIEPGMNQKTMATIEKLKPQAIATIRKRNWEMACQESARHWMELLKSSGISSQYVEGYFVVDSDLYASGEYDDDWSDDVATPHVWLVIGGKVFDPTAGQFNNSSRIWPIKTKDIKAQMYVTD